MSAPVRMPVTPVALASAGILLATACAVAASPPDADDGSRREQRRPLALVYRGPGGCQGCAEAVARLIRASPRNFRVRFVGRPGLTLAHLRRATLYAQPGGNGSVAQAARTIGPRRFRTIRRYVRGGGHYLGFCMGAYLAGSQPGAGLLLPGNTGQYIRTPGASVSTPRNAVIPVRWGKARRRHFAQDPAYIVPSRVAGERVLSRFTNGRVNALVRPYGRGAVGVVGTHPEATRSWYTGTLWSRDTDGLDRRQGLALMRATLGR